MIQIKNIDIEKVQGLSKYNAFLYITDNQSIDERNSKNFEVLLNQLIVYQKNDIRFGSINDLSTTLNQDFMKISYRDICDFLGIIELMFYVFDVFDDYGFRKMINSDFLELSEMTLEDYTHMLNHNGNYNSYVRKKKLNKLNNISLNSLVI